MQIAELEALSDAVGPLHALILLKWLCFGQTIELDVYVSKSHSGARSFREPLVESKGDP